MYTSFCNRCGRVFFDRLPALAENKRDMHLINHSKELVVVPAEAVAPDSVVQLLDSLAEQESVYGPYNAEEEAEAVCQ